MDNFYWKETIFIFYLKTVSNQKQYICAYHRYYAGDDNHNRRQDSTPKRSLSKLFPIVLKLVRSSVVRKEQRNCSMRLQIRCCGSFRRLISRHHRGGVLGFSSAQLLIIVLGLISFGSKRTISRLYLPFSSHSPLFEPFCCRFHRPYYLYCSSSLLIFFFSECDFIPPESVSSCK